MEYIGWGKSMFIVRMGNNKNNDTRINFYVLTTVNLLLPHVGFFVYV